MSLYMTKRHLVHQKLTSQGNYLSVFKTKNQLAHRSLNTSHQKIQPSLNTTMQNLPYLCQGVQTLTQPNLVRGHVFLKEEDTQFLARIPFPGFPKESISVLLDGEFLKVSALTTPVKNELDLNAPTPEPLAGSAAIKIPPQVNKDLITSSYTEGLLTIILPKKEARQIEIQ